MVLTARGRARLRLGVALAACAGLVAGLSWLAGDREADNQRDVLGGFTDQLDDGDG